MINNGITVSEPHENIQWLIAMQNSVLHQIGLSHDNFSAPFGRICCDGITLQDMDRFEDYYRVLSRPRGYLAQVFDIYRKQQDSRLEPPGIPLTTAKADMIWTLASLATACEKVKTSSRNHELKTVQSWEVARVALRSTKKLAPLITVDLISLKQRGVVTLTNSRYSISLPS